MEQRKPIRAEEKSKVEARIDPALKFEVSTTMNGNRQTRLQVVMNHSEQRNLSWEPVGAADGCEDICSPNALVGSIVGEKPAGLGVVGLRAKQAMDLLLGSVILILVAPLMAVIAIAVRLDSRGSALYRQKRIGYKGRTFNLYKFRTMFCDTDDSTHRAYVKEWYAGKSYEQNGNGNGNGTAKLFKISDDSRVTRIGRILRRFSLDELPQIFNVLRLEMSLVGPRPSLSYELEHYQTWHLERLEVPPGITGAWQVSGRNRMSFNEMAKLDIDYARKWSPLLDLTILIKTIPAVFRGTGC
jgi:lipopolysaccharide/colanic/teichoic acid biosynthesis glycosyltransferase